MFDLYNTLESYNIIDNDYAYEGIIDKVKNVGSTIWGWLKKIWETITNKLGELGKKIKKAWESVKNFIKNRGNKSIEEENDEEPYPEENDEDNLSTSTSNKFAKGRGKNITRRRLKSDGKEEDKPIVKSLPEPEKTSRYKSPKLKGNQLKKDLEIDLRFLVRIADYIDVEANRYNEALNIIILEAKRGTKIISDDKAEDRLEYYEDNSRRYSNDEIDSQLTKLENSIANKGSNLLTSKIPSVEKHYITLLNKVSKLNKSAGIILNFINNRLNELKTHHGNYEFNMKNDNGLRIARQRIGDGRTGTNIHELILKKTKYLSSHYTRISAIISKLIVSPN